MMQTIKTNNNRVPILSWCSEIEPEALKQAGDLANHPAVFDHVALMPDTHVGHGMPIGGVIACENAVIIQAVGSDIGCGMCAVQTNLSADIFSNMPTRRMVIDNIKTVIPLGEGHVLPEMQEWDGFKTYPFYDDMPYLSSDSKHHIRKSLGSCGNGNHFLELQKDEQNIVWLMLHSGSRNLGYKIAEYYHNLAVALNHKWHSKIPTDDLAFLVADDEEGQNYIRDMTCAMNFAKENRKRMMDKFFETVQTVAAQTDTRRIFELDIHHNYASLENHLGRCVWIHRKGATSARKDQMGIIPGSMGTSSYIVRGLGNPLSFMSCSHGAGRKMSRTDANLKFTAEQADETMKGIVYDRWHKSSRGRAKGLADISESPLAYKDIDAVMAEQTDLVEIEYKLTPLLAIKG